MVKTGVVRHQYSPFVFTVDLENSKMSLPKPSGKLTFNPPYLLLRDNKCPSRDRRPDFCVLASFY
jgi:hypothetical protein